MADWVQNAREILFRAGIADRGWGYRLGTRPAVEPTVLASLSLLATNPDPPEVRTARTVTGAAGWVAKLQAPDGSIGVAPGIPQPDWTTSYAMLLWATQEGFDSQRRRAADWLLEVEGVAFPKSPGDPVGHDTSLVGWPWVAGTHSWLEPTAMAVLALRREGHADHPRVQEGLKVIRDRALPAGGWNYGNTSAFGNTLRAQPAPTGHAMLALAGMESGGGGDPRGASGGAGGGGEMIDRAAEYLTNSLPDTRAPRSLAWGVLGLAAWGRRPQAADTWLAEAYAPLVKRQEPPYLLAMLLLAAASEQSLQLAGLTHNG